MSLWPEPPLNALITGPTGSGKTEFLMQLLEGPYRNKFEYIVLVCPTFKDNLAYDKGWLYSDEQVVVVVPPWGGGDISLLLKLLHLTYAGTSTLIVLDDCAASKDVKVRTDELASLAFSGRHLQLSIFILTQQYTSIMKLFRDNIGLLVVFYSPSKENNKQIIREYGMELSEDRVSAIIKYLREVPYSRLVFRLRPPWTTRLLAS